MIKWLISLSKLPMSALEVRGTEVLGGDRTDWGVTRCKAAVLNLGYAYPWGYAINSQGVRKQLAVRLKNTQYMVILVFNLIKIKKIAIFGYNKLVRWYNLFTLWCNLDVGVRKGVQVWFGGTRKITVLIWGYASTKRLRTPGVKHQKSPFGSCC